MKQEALLASRHLRNEKMDPLIPRINNTRIMV